MKYLKIFLEEFAKSFGSSLGTELAKLLIFMIKLAILFFVASLM